ncbi:MAG: DUF4404 family protein [Proteobacteria bacterium]|nr:DUF4404 family protein [Pseudomonadota bacterium]
MPERSSRLADTLAELHQQLEDTHDLAPEDREELERAADEIREILGPEASAPAELSERLRKTVRRFEETHPRLTAVVGRVIDALADMGI